MYVIVIGGGNTGSQLAKFLLEANHKVCVIEERPAVLRKLETEIPQESILTGDGSSPAILEKANIQNAQVLAAVTGSDETNLVITTLGRFEFNVPRIIARVNNAKNAWLFTPEMGVDVSLNQAEILSRLCAEEMSVGDMMTMLKIRRGKYSIVEEKIARGAPAIGVELKDLSLPNNCVISGIIRHGEMVLPRGTTILEEGDEVLALVDDPAREKLAILFESKKGVDGSLDVWQRVSPQSLDLVRKTPFRSEEAQQTQRSTIPSKAPANLAMNSQLIGIIRPL